MKLTDKQKEAILTATKDRDYCTNVNRRTMNSLIKKGLAKYTSGFGYKYGVIIGLTEKGIEIHNMLTNQ